MAHAVSFTLVRWTLINLFTTYSSDDDDDRPEDSELGYHRL